MSNTAKPKTVWVFVILACLVGLLVVEYRETRASRQRMYQRGFEEGMKACK